VSKLKRRRIVDRDTNRAREGGNPERPVQAEIGQKERSNVRKHDGQLRDLKRGSCATWWLWGCGGGGGVDGGAEGAFVIAHKDGEGRVFSFGSNQEGDGALKKTWAPTSPLRKRWHKYLDLSQYNSQGMVPFGPNEIELGSG